MFSKNQLRSKFLKLRKKKYIDIDENFFKPLIKIIKEKKIGKINKIINFLNIYFISLFLKK